MSTPRVPSLRVLRIPDEEERLLPRLVYHSTTAATVNTAHTLLLSKRVMFDRCCLVMVGGPPRLASGTSASVGDAARVGIRSSVYRDASAALRVR